MNKYNLKYVITHFLKMSKWDWMNVPTETIIELVFIVIGIIAMFGFIVYVLSILFKNIKKKK